MSSAIKSYDSRMESSARISEPRDHHYVPQFYLRNFAVDEEKSKIPVASKHGHMVVWAERSIKTLGYERDFYVYTRGGVPVSVETDINRRIEVPISQSDTWAKIVSGHAEQLDRSDRAILYALIRHLEARTPQYQATMIELARMATDPNSAVPFSGEERVRYASMLADPDLAQSIFAFMAATTEWSEKSFESSLITVLRSPIPLYSSTTPVLAMSAPEHPSISLPLPGMVPYQLMLPVNPNTIVCLVQGDFDGHFTNQQIEQKVALGLNRYFTAQFAYYDAVRHLVADKTNLVSDLTWACYDFVDDTGRRMRFRRRP
jgi:hypothetical protein